MRQNNSETFKHILNFPPILNKWFGAILIGQKNV